MPKVSMGYAKKEEKEKNPSQKAREEKKCMPKSMEKRKEKKKEIR